ncbi:MAG: FtsX-like permease family protein [Planctomycetota bacterium]
MIRTGVMTVIGLVLALGAAAADTLAEFDYQKYIDASAANREYLDGVLDNLAGDGIGSRVTGYPDCDEAAVLVERELLAILGEDQVRKEGFDVAVPVQKNATLDLDGVPAALQCLWPNFIRLPSLPDGVTGPVVYVGQCEYRQMDGKQIAGTIVVADFNCEERFLEVMKLGARALVFVPADTDRDNSRYQAGSKIVANNMDIPRYYLDRAELARLEAALAPAGAVQEARDRYAADPRLRLEYHNAAAYACFTRADAAPTGTLKAVMVWEKRKAWNFYGTIPGRGFKGFSARVEGVEVKPEGLTVIRIPAAGKPPLITKGDKVYFTSGPYAGKSRLIVLNDKFALTVDGALPDAAGSEFTLRADFESVKQIEKQIDDGAFESVEVLQTGEGAQAYTVSVFTDDRADFLRLTLTRNLRLALAAILGLIVLVHAVLLVRSRHRAGVVQSLVITAAIAGFGLGIASGYTAGLADKRKGTELFLRFESGALAGAPENPYRIETIENDRLRVAGDLREGFRPGDAFVIEQKQTTFTDTDADKFRSGTNLAINFCSGSLAQHSGNPFPVAVSAKNRVTVIGALADGFQPGDAYRIEEKGAMLFMAGYDSMSVVPGAAPGAEQAGGMVALLNLARVFKAAPAARDVTIVAVSARYQGFQGVREFAVHHAWAGHRDKVIARGDYYIPVKFDMAFFLDLNSRGSQLGLCGQSNGECYQSFRYGPENFDELKKVLGSYAEAYTAKLGRTCLFENMKSAIDVALNEKMAWQQVSAAYYLVGCGNRAATISSLYTNRDYEDTPFDTVAHMDRDNLHRQIGDLTAVMAQCLDDPFFFRNAPAKKIPDSAVIVDGSTYYFDKDRNFMPNTPVPGTLVTLVRDELRPPSQCGVRSYDLAFSDRKGKFAFLGFYDYWANLRGYKMDAVTGRIQFATDFGKNGHLMYPVKQKIAFEHDKTVLVVLFECVDVAVYDLMDPRYFNVINRLAYLNSDNVVPESWGMAFGLEDAGRYPYATLFASPKQRIKVIGRRGVFGIQYLVPGNREAAADADAPQRKVAAQGDGRPVTAKDRLTLTAADVAQSMAILNEYRLGVLNKFGIRNAELDTLNALTRTSLAEARTRLVARDYTGYQRNLHCAFQAASKVYPQILQTTNDSLKGVIFFFALLIPFAYFIERLVFGFPQILRAVLAVFIIFLAVFMIFRFIHPVFQITETPYIILLAFILLALSIFVTVYIVRKFNDQMAELKRKAAKVHHSDVQRLGAMVAAIRLGISNMRNRKVRTTLTTFTLVLLTFIVLSFVSISSRSDFYKISISDQPMYKGCLVRDRGWGRLDNEILNAIRLEFGTADHIISPRFWYFESKKNEKVSESLKLNVFLPARDAKFQVKAILGMGPDEDRVTGVARFMDHGAWFGPDRGDDDACIIPSYMAEKLGLTPEELARIDGHDRSLLLVVYGKTLWVKGVINSSRLDNIVDIDNERLTPTDPGDRELGGAGNVAAEIQQMKSVKSTIKAIKPAKHVSPDFVLFAPPQVVRELGGTLRSIAVAPVDRTNTVYLDRIDAFLQRVGIMIFVSNGNESKAFTPKMSTGLQGFANILVPLIIAAMIVLNTMMGAVHERHSEIRTYSSVGLAPKHIGALFLAESVVYSVVGGVSGFLIAQVLAKVVQAMGWLDQAGIELNYSSTSTVLSIMLVMLVVILSTIYPARMASDLSVPDVTRKWKLVPPEGDEWVFDFPFTVPRRGAEGIIIFLNNYFEGYKEESIGSFYTDNVQLGLRRNEFGDGYAITMRIWIAPFDMGVSQMTEFMFLPTEDAGVMKIIVHITRVAGEQKAWVRLNKGFLGELRKQFLIWRTIAPDIQAAYTTEGHQLLSRKQEG